MSSTCLFCKLGAHEIPSYKVLEDDQTIAFLDIQPLAPGHTVVIPKKHAARLPELDSETTAALFLTVKRVSDIIHASLKPDGLTIGINDGPGAGIGIPHVHVHIIPRWTSDGGSNIHSIVHHTPKESLDSILARLTSS
jgi:histidine triad (HIT) family protein